ncbi:hypothetical protein [Herbiconiux flava]|uniref:Uncharacterized protein n=1 Tax=Herbiconiux flava TaxID=881268 RepID=A0A852SHT5_9MICO|nr:hypothetical protein [Herbiconiux flava]NYD69234.1 hypothetical protein [Herbiconiux flava]GLK15982.1 hypothetical protein GCM10017602_04640 [Herbiconiux flava]
MDDEERRRLADQERRRLADEQERRALQALETIVHGGDLGAETLALSNEFTDRHTARLKSWLAARLRGGRGPQP